MPIVKIEYTSSLRYAQNLITSAPQIHDTLVRLLPAETSSCRTHFTQKDDFYIADGDVTRAFVHMQVRVMAGRSPKVLESTGQALLALLESVLTKARQQQSVIISVEIDKISKNYYRSMS